MRWGVLLRRSLGFVALVTLAALPAEAARVIGVRIGVDGDRTRVVFELDAAANHSREPIQGEGSSSELVIRLDAASEARQVLSKSELVRSVKVEPSNGGAVARIGLRSPDVNIAEMSLSAPNRLVIDIRPRAGARLAAPAPEAPKPPPAPAPVAAPAPAPPPTPKAATGPSAPPTAFERDVERQLNERVGLPAPPLGDNGAAGTPTEAAAPSAEAEPGVPEGESAAAATGATPEAPPAEEAPAEQAAPAETPPPTAAAEPAPAPAKPGPGIDATILAAAAIALLLLVLVWRRLVRRAPVAAEAAPEPTPTVFAPPPPPAAERLPLFEPPAPTREAEVAPAPAPEPTVDPELGLATEVGASESDALFAEADLETIGEREAEALVDVPTIAPYGAAPRAPEPDVATARLVRELERRIAHLETRLEEAADARERLERHVSAQTEELRVQRAAIARTQRVLRSLARPEDLATEPAPRDPNRGPGGA